MPVFSIYTLGCKVNQYESQSIAEKLIAMGLTEGNFDEKCDLFLINTCAVTAESTRKARQLIRRAHKTNPDAPILVMGCYSQLAPSSVSSIEGVKYVCGTRNKNSAAEEAIRLLREKDAPVRVSIPTGQEPFEPMRITRFDRTRAYVKIEDGCASHCAYCVIKNVRGKVVSRPRKDVLDEIRTLACSGCREVVLTGIETSAYEYDLAGLMEEIETIDGIDRVRLGSLDPVFMKKEFIDRISALKKTVPHFHLSIQSGSSSVLARMKRKYNAETALRNIEYMKEKMPDLQLSADVITGFPGETEEDFLQTVGFAKRVRFLHIHVFPYSKRPGTIAAAMPDQVPEEIRNARARTLSLVQKEIKTSILEEVKGRGEPLEILLETLENGFWHGHTPNFLEAAVPSAPDLEKGTILRAMPERIENEILYCERILPPCCTTSSSGN